MKHLLLILALAFGFAAVLPASALAKDKDDWHKVQKEFRGQVQVLQQNWSLHRDRVKNTGDRRQWKEMQDIRTDIDNISAQVDAGNFDPRDIRARIDQATANLDQVQAQLDHKAQRPQGGFYTR